MYYKIPTGWVFFCLCSENNILLALIFAGGSVGLVGEPPPLPPLTMATKAESVASVTSQCSFSSTIVHVGDKKPPESGGHPQHFSVSVLKVFDASNSGQFFNESWLKQELSVSSLQLVLKMQYVCLV